LVEQGRLAEAESALDKAANLSPKDSSVLTLLGKVKGRLGQFPEAIALFQRVIQLHPNSAEAHVNLAIAFSDAGVLPKALEETTKALAIDPNLASAHLNRARILDDLKREREAAAEFAVARKLSPSDPDVYYYWSFVEHAAGRFAQESALLERAVKLQPENEKAFILLANSLLDQSKKPEAETVLRSALAVHPNSAEATYMLSRLVVKTNPGESRLLMDRFTAIRARSDVLDRSKALGNEGYTAFMAQDWPKAIGLLKEALTTCGDCEIEATLHKNLGLALCRSGNLTEGRGELRKALSLNPNDSDAVKALSIIGQ